MILLAAMLSPREVRGQQGSIIATARVVGRPLSLRTVTSTADGRELHVGIDGNGPGSITVDGRRADGTLVRIAQRELTGTGNTGRRDMLLPLIHGDSATILHFEVRLSQSDALLAPSLSQVIIRAAATRTGNRSALLY
jgi:hypothetical protein